MREILFRAKGKGSGNWLYGYYSRLSDATGMNDVLFVPAEDPDDSNHTYCIIPETVGQYTGLKDRNGNKIFEGDVLSGYLDVIVFPEEEARGCVCWNDYGWHIKIGAHCDTLEQDWASFFEIIGNIYDNPELVEVEENG